MELHSTVKIDGLSDSWDEEEKGIALKAYELCFTSEPNDQTTYSNIMLLIKSELDEDITSTKIDLFLTVEKIVRAQIFPREKMTLDSSQMKNAKAFQQIILNGIFGNTRKKEKLNEMKNPWCNSYIFFLLPLTSDRFGVTVIDWKCIEICASRAREFNLLSQGRHSIIDIEKDREVPMAETTQAKPDSLVLATEICEFSDLIDKAVLTIRNGTLYQVVEIIHDKTSESSFPLEKDAKRCYASYAEYFQKRYGKKLDHLSQPLLRVKHAKRPRNFLSEQQVSSSKDGVGTCVELPPELCLNLDIPSSFMRSLCLLPSVMRRLHSAMLASQLNKAIKIERPNCPLVPIQLIMEAITSHRCLESYSYERLELLGDSFLKYAISQHIFMKYESEDEGQLAIRRTDAVNNKTLHDLALERNLQGYIVDDLFDVYKWMAPGLYCQSIVQCSCNPGDPNTLQMGIVCDNGHRWIHSKTISDVVEALIGAHLVGGGVNAAIEFMQWMNMEVGIEDKLVEIASQRSFNYPSVLDTNLDELESYLNYHFVNRCLLVEALTHCSLTKAEGPSYQRLEFLGDSVLELVITEHLYSAYQESSEGILSDLRQVAVNNENFSQAIVKHKIHNYLRHSSYDLQNQIAKFVEKFEQLRADDCQFVSFGGGLHAPKVLGDILESISGAILVDSRLRPDVVWEKIKPILSPIVTPQNIELQPLWELYELCAQKHYKYNWMTITKKGNVNGATVKIKVKESIVFGEGSDINKRFARTKAAKHALAKLKIIATGSGQVDEGDNLFCNRESSEVHIPHSVQRGDYRSHLYELCQRMHFSEPKFSLVERSEMPHNARFVFKVGVDISKENGFSIQGEEERDHASAKDSAAYKMLVELQKNALCSIEISKNNGENI